MVGFFAVELGFFSRFLGRGSLEGMITQSSTSLSLEGVRLSLIEALKADMVKIDKSQVRVRKIFALLTNRYELCNSL